MHIKVNKYCWQYFTPGLFLSPLCMVLNFTQLSIVYRTINGAKANERFLGCVRMRKQQKGFVLMNCNHNNKMGYKE